MLGAGSWLCWARGRELVMLGAGRELVMLGAGREWEWGADAFRFW
jgi:hypothetical protein